MSLLGMFAHAQALADDTPLHGKVIVGIKRGALICTPRNGTVVNYDIMAKASAKSICALGLIDSNLLVSHTETKVSYNDVICIHHHRIVSKTYTVTRGRLTGDGDVRLANIQLFVQMDGS